MHFQRFKMDAARWVAPSQIGDPHAISGRELVSLLYRTMSLRAMAWFRFGQWCRSVRVPGLPGIVQRHIHARYGLEIAVATEIGGGLYIAHPTGCVIAPARMGENCSIIAAVTIGMRNEWEFPQIGDRVFIGAGARVLGGIALGSDAIVGANAVVLHDVPAGATVVGIPAKVSRLRGERVAVAVQQEQ